MAKSIESYLQEALGSLTFSLLSTQAQLDATNEKIKELEAKLAEKEDEKKE